MGRSRKRSNKFNQIPPFMYGAVLFLLLLGIILLVRSRFTHTVPESTAVVESTALPLETTTEAVTEAETTEPETTVEETTIETEAEPQPNENGYYEKDFEKEIYSYVQCYEDTYFGDQRWAGEWSHINAGGQDFHFFGCGVCCLSNIYSTLSGEDTAPTEMYEFSRANSDWNPDGGYGAMSWAQLKHLCEDLGLRASICRKPDYQTFRQDLSGADATIILVCKDNDPKYWWYTSGHYVTIWGYDPDEDSVFITDPSGLFNRVRVLLPDLYNALKTASDAQYMLVNKE